MSPGHPRVASLLPSATEMVCALGARADLVGISHECDHPAGLEGLAVLTSTKVRPSPLSAEIDRDVRAVLRGALAVYDIDVEALRRAAPDCIVTQDLCDVCAVSLEDVERALRSLDFPGTRIVNLHPTRLADIWADLGRVGAALGRAGEAERVVAGLKQRVEAVRSRAAGLGKRPRVLTIEWLDPVMIGGTWMPELVELAGGEALVTRPGDHAPTLGLEELRGLEPEVVVIKPCGFVLERTLAEGKVIEKLLADTDWPATRAGAVWVADGNAYFNRPGPRIADSLEILAACVHPGEFADLARRYEGGFRRFGSGPRGS